MKKEIKRKLEKQEKGITLIALVVTIVVLLILAGVSINVIFGDTGIIKMAQEAVDKTKDAIQKEQDEIEALEKIWNEDKKSQRMKILQRCNLG